MRNMFKAVTLLLCAALLALPACTAHAAMGSIRSFTQIEDAKTDIVGKGMTIAADGLADVGFSATLTGAGAITRITLKDLTANRTWDTSTSDSVPVLVVRAGKDDAIVNTGRSLGLFPFLLGAQFSIWINDRESVLAKDAKLELTIHFADKTSAKATLDVKGIAVADKTGGIVSAEYKGLQRRDIPGLRRMRRAPRSRGRGDEFLLTEVTLKEQGTIVGFRLRNTAGPAGTWDTAMERGNDLLLVLPPNSSEMLNDQDGAVNTPIDGERTFHLLAAENDALSNPDAQTTLYVFLDGNRTIQKQIARAGASAASSDGPKLKTVEFRGKGAYDFVSDADKPGANLNPDSFIAISLNATGTLSGIKVVGTWDAADGKKASATWDSIPSNSNPALVVTRADGKPVNRLDGSLSEQIGGDDDLLIWFDTGAPITKSYSFTVTLLFSDGKALEGNASGSM